MNMFSQIHKDITDLFNWLSKYIFWLIVISIIGWIIAVIANNWETVWQWAAGICLIGLILWLLEAIVTFLYSFKLKNNLKEKELKLKKRELEIRERELNTK